MDERETKLPTWAQDRLALLRGSLANAEKAIAAFSGNERTPVSARFLVNAPDGRTLYFPADTTVAVEGEDGSRITMQRHDGTVRIAVLEGRLEIAPDAANCVHVRQRKA